MQQAVAESPASNRSLAARRNSSFKWLWRGGLAVASLLVIGIITLAINWPFTKQGLIDVLQQRSVRSVTIDRFHTTLFPPGCVAEGIHFLHRKHKNKAPLINIDKLIIAGSYWGMIPPRKRLSGVRAIGMHITVPPRDPSGAPNPIMPLTHSSSGPALLIGTVIANGAVLDFLHRDAKKPPFRLVVHELSLEGVGNNQPMHYRAVIYNTKPPSEIRSEGFFGVWNPDEPAATPVRGTYHLLNANLAAFQALSGTLRADGNFTGTLDQIAADGKVAVPNFHVNQTARTRPLTADFRATISATDGDVSLDHVTAQFDNTTVAARGTIKGSPGQEGKNVSLDLVAANGRIEDVLRLFIADQQSPITGNVAVRAHFEWPAGSDSFVRGIIMRGGFGVAGGKFKNDDIQASLSRLSQSAAKKDGMSAHEDPATVVTDLRGTAVIKNGIANLHQFELLFPGGQANMSGTYSLIDYGVDLHGTAITDGSVSAAATGVKSFFLKTIAPFLKKKGREAVPFKITGNYGKLKVGLDFGHKRRLPTDGERQTAQLSSPGPRP